MSGLLAIFILVLSYFILNFSQATAQLTQNDVTRAELLRFLQRELEREGITVTIDDRHGILRISEGVRLQGVRRLQCADSVAAGCGRRLHDNGGEQRHSP